MEGKTLLEHALDTLYAMADRIVVSCNSMEKVSLYKEILKNEIDFVLDPPNMRGPFAGVYAALRYCPEELLVVLPVDSPFVSTSLLGTLISKARLGYLASLVAPNGQLFPITIAMNRKIGLRIAEALVRIERTRMTDFHRAYPNLFYVNISRRNDWIRSALNLNKPNSTINQKLLNGHLKEDVEIKRFALDIGLEKFIDGLIEGSLWHTVKTGDPYLEFKLYASRGLYSLAAKSLLDSGNSLTRYLGDLLLRSLSILIDASE